MALFESDSERAEREHNQGQKDGSQADCIQDFTMHIFNDPDTPYMTGWDNGYDNKPDDE